MKNRSLQKSSLIEVVCDACAALYDPRCVICRGEKFYYWDPKSEYCYTADGLPMRYIDILGDEVQVRRPAKTAPTPVTVSLEIMLSYIEIWIADSPEQRSFKLTYTTSWICTITESVSRESFFADDVAECVRKCYGYLLQA